MALTKYKTFYKRLGAGIIDTIVFIPFILLDNYFFKSENNFVYAGWMLFYITCYGLYSVIGHGKFGKTIGKKLMNIRVLDLDEQNVIGYKRAFIRDSFWIIADMILIVCYLAAINNTIEHDHKLRSILFVTYMDSIMFGWFFLELITMLFNKKRRAIHDFMAGSVVIDLNVQLDEMNREKS